MDANVIVTLVGSLGFPVCMAIALFWYVNKLTESNNARIDKIQAEHKEEIQKVTEALNNNTLALQRLCDRMEVDNNGK